MPLIKLDPTRPSERYYRCECGNTWTAKVGSGGGPNRRKCPNCKAPNMPVGHDGAPYEPSVNRHGVKPAERKALAESGCALCGATSPGTPNGWSLDHDHSHCPGTTGCRECVRGILCQACNTLLGSVEKAISMGIGVQVHNASVLGYYLRSRPFAEPVSIESC